MLYPHFFKELWILLITYSSYILAVIIYIRNIIQFISKSLNNIELSRVAFKAQRQIIFRRNHNYSSFRLISAKRAQKKCGKLLCHTLSESIMQIS